MILLYCYSNKVEKMPKQAQAKTRRNQSRVSKSSSPDENKRMAEDEQDVRDARRALKEARKKGSVPWEQVKRELGI